MDSEILGLIVKELNKNGVNLIKHDFSNIDTFSPENVDYFRPGELPQIFDFSEHDKVFEDKIANLENQIAYMKEKKNYLRTRCMEDATDAFDSGAYGRLTIVGRRVDLETENEKLKQRIAELESKETKKPINGWICVAAKEINGQEYVKLEDFLQVVNDLQAEIGT